MANSLAGDVLYRKAGIRGLGTYVALTLRSLLTPDDVLFEETSEARPGSRPKVEDDAKVAFIGDLSCACDPPEVP